MWRQNNNSSILVAPKPRDPDAMDVDAIRKVTTEVEKEKYCAEGRCFTCGCQGHISHFCLDKKPQAAAISISDDTKDKSEAAPTESQVTLNSVHIAKEAKDDPVAKIVELAIGLDAEQQDKLAMKMTKLGVDFQ